MAVKLAVIGCGGIAQLVHIPSAKKVENAELVAVCDLYEDVAREVAGKYRVESFYTDYWEMFEKEEIDAVINATGHAQHAPVSVDAAKAGKHVLVEKPMAVTVKQCEEMIEACRKNQVKLMVAFMKRFDPSLQWVKDLLEKRELGTPFVINSWYCDSIHHGRYVSGFIDQFIRTKESPKPLPMPEADFHLSVLLGHGVHHMDLLHWMGGEVKTVFSSFKRSNKNYVSTSVLEYESGCLGYYQLAGTVTKDWDEGLTIHGTKGSAEAKIRFPYFKERSKAHAYLLDRNEYVSKMIPKREQYLDEIQHFVDSIVKDTEPIPGGYDGLIAEKMAYAVYESAMKGKKIVVR